MVLQRAGDDLRGRGRAAVDQHHDRRAIEHVTRRGLEFHLGIRHAALGVDDQPLVEEGVAHADGGIEHAARIVAQIEHQPPELALVLRLQFPDDVGQPLVGAGLELGDAHITKTGVEHTALHALDLDDRARQRDLDRLGGAFARNGERDVGAGLAAHETHGLGERHALHRLVVEANDEVTGLDATACRRGVFDR